MAFNLQNWLGGSDKDINWLNEQIWNLSPSERASGLSALYGGNLSGSDVNDFLNQYNQLSQAAGGATLSPFGNVPGTGTNFQEFMGLNLNPGTLSSGPAGSTPATQFNPTGGDYLTNGSDYWNSYWQNYYANQQPDLSYLTDYLNQATTLNENIWKSFEPLAANLNESLANLRALPGTIDQWANQQLGQYRLEGDDIIGALNAVAQARSGRGIMGGTEAQNLTANTLSALRRDVQEKQQGILDKAMAYKVAAQMAEPQLQMQPINTLAQLASISGAQQYNWANLYQQMIDQGLV